jgi:hypothetical protein
LPGLELRPRLASEIVDGAFQLYRRHFSDLVTLSALVFAPYVLLQLLLVGGADAPAGLAESMILVGLAWVFGSIADAAIVLSVSNSYLRDDPDAGGALRQTLARIGTVLLAVMAKWAIIGAGMAAAIIAGAIFSALVVGASVATGAPAPTTLLGVVIALILILLSLPLALYFYARYFAVPATVMLEGVGVRAGLRRSKELSRGFKRKVLSALGLSALVLVIMQAALSALFALVPGPSVIGFLLGQAVTVVAYPVLGIITTLLYYDARIRKEGFDIEVMAAELGIPVAAPQEPPPA